jgi:hypothetical protein
MLVRYPAGPMPRVNFSTFSVELPPGWGDITADVETDDPPATVARDDGVGALQFSVGLYESGPRPKGDVAELEELLDDFAESRGWTSPRDAIRELSPRPLVGATFRWDTDIARVWYVSEQGNIAFITYTCEASRLEARELAEAELIVRSLTFGGAAAE